MNTQRPILIVGAGSTGLSAALFLSELGYKPRIVEQRKEPLRITKALGVNPVTLKSFEDTEVTRRFLENGWRNSCMNFWCKDRIIYKNDFSTIDHPYPFMLVQPQFETEQIIEEALAERKISVERNIRVESMSAGNNSVQLSFTDDKNNTVEQTSEGIIVGADGHKSTIRECMGVGFEGWEHPEEFKMYDIELETPVMQREGHYYFFNDGGMLLLHIRNGIWRVAGNMNDLLNYLPKGTKAGKISWETTFTIRERVATRFNKENVFLLGDAAHIHSPVGARGMNLCIEDSYIFSQLLKKHREQEYHHIRYSKIKKTVGFLGQMTDKIAGHSFAGKTIRNNMDKLTVFFPLVMPRVKKFLLGLN